MLKMTVELMDQARTMHFRGTDGDLLRELHLFVPETAGNWDLVKAAQAANALGHVIVNIEAEGPEEKLDPSKLDGSDPWVREADM